MTRSDFSLCLILASFFLLSYTQNTQTLIAFVSSVIFHTCLMLVPIVFDSKEAKLRKEFSEALAAHEALLETLKSRVDVITLSRGGR